MKKNLLILILILFVFPFTQVKAAHLIGGEITYECLGNGEYIITMKIFRDCQGGGAPFDGPGNGRMSIFNGSSNIEFDRIRMVDADITDVQPDVNNPCLILPSNICVQQGIYEMTLSDIGMSDLTNQGINLPLSTESYHIVYQRCCRNNSITNLINPQETGVTYYVEITPESQALCNNTPTFNDFPPIVVCVNEDLIFDHSATDIDGDLLVYELCSPLKGGGNANILGTGFAADLNGTNPNPDAPPPFTNVTFGAVYNPNNPLGGGTPLAIDPSTGLLTGFPETQGQFVVGICVKEFRNGILLSTIQRDFQFNVAFCEPTVVAAVDGDDLIQTDPLFFFSNCDGDSTFNFEAPTSQFITDYIWEFDLGGLNPLSFTQQSIDITFPGFGIYEGLLILNPGTDCGDTATIEVEIFEPPLAGFSFDYDTCVAGPVTYVDQSLATPFHPLDVWEWDFGDGQISNEESPVVNYTAPGVYNVSLQVTDENGCINSLTQEVTWLPVPPLIVIDPSSFDGCAPLDVFFNNLSEPIDNSYNIVWDFGDGGISDVISPSYTYAEPGSYTINVGITSPIGCFTERTFSDLILVDSFPEADFVFGPDRITNFEPTVNFFDQSVRDDKWRWNFNGLGTSFEENPSFSFPDTGHQIVELIVTTPAGCEDTIQKVIDVIPEVRYFLPNAFTPNDDTVNDEFIGVGFFRGMKAYNFTVYNRWGELVFESDDPLIGWNGRTKNGGAIQPAGVYVCHVTYIDPRGTPKEVKGFITLVK